jgi:hypothetical protein
MPQASALPMPFARLIRRLPLDAQDTSYLAELARSFNLCSRSNAFFHSKRPVDRSDERQGFILEFAFRFEFKARKRFNAQQSLKDFKD